MDVRVKDRKDEIEFIRMALNLAEMGINYCQADLIDRVLKELDKKGGQFNLNDGISIHHKWKEDWRKYFEEQRKETLENSREEE